MSYRTEIERALNEMVSDEVGNKFQGLAVVRAQKQWPRLIACERKWDGGLDAQRVVTQIHRGGVRKLSYLSDTILLHNAVWWRSGGSD